MPEEDNGSTDQKVYGCIFCLTGKEDQIIEHLKRTNPDIRCTVVRQVKRKTYKGVTRQEEAIIFPGYVFFETDEDYDTSRFWPLDGLISLLKEQGRDWRLRGEDESFAKWLFSYNGIIQMSKAYQEGDRIRIISGPLKDFEGQISRVDKRNKSGQVSLTFDQRTIKVWLGFELVDRVTEPPLLQA